MALHFILDGYNITRSAKNPMTGGTLEEERGRLVQLVQSRRPQGSAANRVTIVFDGPEQMPYMNSIGERSYVGDIEVMFSGGRSADDIIEEIGLRDKPAAETVVVSNDRGLRRRLGGSGVKFISVEEFLARSAKQRGGALSGGKQLDEPEAEEVTGELMRHWMERER